MGLFEREQCKHFIQDESGCALNKTRWCMPWGKCCLFEKKTLDKVLKTILL